MGARAALYITCLELTTSAATATAHTVATPANVRVANCDAPPKMVSDVDQPTTVGIRESTTATPTTNPNGTTGTNNGMASAMTEVSTVVRR